MWRVKPLLQGTATICSRKTLSNKLYITARYSVSLTNLNKPTSIQHKLYLSRLPPLVQERLYGTDQHGHVHADDFASMLGHSSKKGMQVTWIGFVSNVGLTISKGAAGWLTNSASLLADAAHSFSDLLSDFVTLYTFKMSRKVPDQLYPYGYGKYETMGSLSVSALLIAGGIGIGLHSFDLLLATLNGSQHMMVTQSIDTAASVVTTSSESLVDSFSADNNNALDPNAAWFALGSVLVKEWLYRTTLKVGKSERSDVLIANAWHHRSDAYSSFVALVAIGGTYAGIPIFDPLGGIIVSGMILKSGGDIICKSTKELMDQSISESELDEIKSIIASVKDKEIDLLDFYSIRGRKFGPFHHLDLILHLNPNLPIYKSHEIEQKVRLAIKKQCRHVQEVIIHIDAEKQPRHF